MRHRWAHLLASAIRNKAAPLSAKMAGSGRGYCPARLHDSTHYFGGCGGFGMADSIRIFNFPLSGTYTAVQRPATSMGDPAWFLPVFRNSPMARIISVPKGHA